MQGIRDFNLGIRLQHTQKLTPRIDLSRSLFSGREIPVN